MGQFKMPPISTLAGSTLINYLRVLKQGRIAPEYYIKVVLTLLIIIVSTPFHWWESILFKRRLSKFRFEKPPLFIIGHWRSGTTLLHNMLCADPEAGYVTTYQSLFPNNLGSKWIFKTFMRINTPEKRPSDNVKLDVDFPQEDEFAFGNVQPNAYYNFFYFPNEYKTFYEKAVHHKNLTEKEKKRWFNEYGKLLKKALINSNGKRLVVKNPVNTARIKHILKLCPDAKFLYIYRNPVTVYLSTEKFFRNLLPVLLLQKVDPLFMEMLIFDVYKKLEADYVQQKALIPEGNLYELKYEEFEKHPVKEIKRIYSELLHEDFDKAKEYFNKYFESIKGYKKNSYKVNRELLEKIRAELGDYMKKYGYDIPDDIVVD